MDHVSISKAAKRIKIKLTTARLIVKKYKETGTYPMKKFKEAVPVQAEISRNR
jgi:transposase